MGPSPYWGPGWPCSRVVPVPGSLAPGQPLGGSGGPATSLQLGSASGLCSEGPTRQCPWGHFRSCPASRSSGRRGRWMGQRGHSSLSLCWSSLPGWAAHQRVHRPRPTRSVSRDSARGPQSQWSCLSTPTLVLHVFPPVPSIQLCTGTAEVLREPENLGEYSMASMPWMLQPQLGCLP